MDCSLLHKDLPRGDLGRTASLNPLILTGVPSDSNVPHTTPGSVPAAEPSRTISPLEDLMIVEETLS